MTIVGLGRLSMIRLVDRRRSPARAVEAAVAVLLGAIDDRRGGRCRRRCLGGPWEMEIRRALGCGRGRLLPVVGLDLPIIPILATDTEAFWLPRLGLRDRFRDAGAVSAGCACVVMALPPHAEPDRSTLRAQRHWALQANPTRSSCFCCKVIVAHNHTEHMSSALLEFRGAFSRRRRGWSRLPAYRRRSSR